MKLDSKQIHIRMLIGGAVGFVFLFALCILLLSINGWFAEPTNQYSGSPPLMIAFVFGFFGLVFGSLLGLIKFRSPYFWIFIIIFFGGCVPLLPNSWLQFFPGWFEKAVLLLGFIFIILSLIPLNRNKTKKE